MRRLPAITVSKCDRLLPLPWGEGWGEGVKYLKLKP